MDCVYSLHFHFPSVADLEDIQRLLARNADGLERLPPKAPYLTKGVLKVVL